MVYQYASWPSQPVCLSWLWSFGIHGSTDEGKTSEMKSIIYTSLWPHSLSKCLLNHIWWHFLNNHFTCLSGVGRRGRVLWLLCGENESWSTIFKYFQSKRTLKYFVSGTCSVFADEVVLGFAIVVVPLEHVKPPQTGRSGRLVIHHHTHLVAAWWLIPMPVPTVKHTHKAHNHFFLELP